MRERLNRPKGFRDGGRPLSRLAAEARTASGYHGPVWCNRQGSRWLYSVSIEHGAVRNERSFPAPQSATREPDRGGVLHRWQVTYVVHESLNAHVWIARFLRHINIVP